MAEINEIVSKDAIESVLKAAKGMTDLDNAMIKFYNDQEKFKQQSEQISATINDNSEKSKKYAETINAVANDTKKLTEYEKELANQQRQIASTEAKIAVSQTQTNQKLNEKKQTLKELNEITKLNSIINDQNAGTIEKLTAQNKILAIEKKKLNIETAEGKKRLDEIIAAENENNKALKVGHNEEQKRIIGIGQYKNAFGGLIQQFTQGEIGTKQLANGFLKLGKQMIITFVTNPIFLALGAIVLLIKNVVSAIGESEERTNKMKEAFARFQPILRTIGDAFEVVADIVIKYVDFMGKAIAAVTEFLGINPKGSADEFVNAEKSKQKAILETRKLNEDASNQEAIIAEQREIIANKEDYSYKQRVEALKIAGEAEKKLSADRQKIAEMNLAALEAEAALDDNNAEMNDKLSAATIALNKARKESADVGRKLAKEQQKLSRENAADMKAEADAAKAAAKEKADYDKKLADEQFKIASDAAKQEYDMQLMMIQATSKTKEEAENRTFEFKKQSLLKTLDLQQIELDSFKGTELEKLAIQERINKTRFDLEKVGMEERIKLNEEGIKKMEPIKEKELGLEKGKLQEVAAASQQNAEQEIIRQEQTAEQKKQIIEAATAGVIQIQGALFDFMDAKYQGDLQRLEQKNAAGLISDQEYAKQKAEIEIKQAKASRLKAIFEATIGTAQAVIAALQTKPFFPLGLIMAATAGVVGGLQIASILSQPLPTMPAFAEGTDSAPGYGLFGEKGRELMRTTGGEMIIANEPTVFSGNKFKGAKIWNNDETEYIMSRTREPQFGQPTRTDDRILRGLNSVEKAIKDKPVFIFDKDKNVVGMVRGSHTERYINRLKLNQ